MAKYTFLELVEDVLRKANMPLAVEDIWELANRYEFSSKLSSIGKTPWQTIGARLYTDLKKNPKTIFEKVGRRPVKFGIKGLASTLDVNQKLPVDLPKKPEYKERQLHPFLAFFAYVSLRGVRAKTIFHENSTKKGYSEWLHPDMVGFYFPIEDWEKEVVELGQRSGANVLVLYSFELKRELNFSNLREAFFQAVSNSSWANEGYLVAANISHNEDFRSELERLSFSFGIGVIEIDVNEPDSSAIIFAARRKNELDWESINKLAEVNPDFKKFLSDVSAVLQTNRIYDSEFDEVFSEADDLKKTLA